jgi:hypothetical protein
MRVKKHLYAVNHTWILLVAAGRDDAVPAARKGRLLAEVDLSADHVQADLDDARRRLEEHGYCLNHPANGLLRQFRGA